MVLRILIFLVSLLAYGSYGLPGLGCLAAATVVSFLAARHGLFAFRLCNLSGQGGNFIGGALLRPFLCELGIYAAL